MSNIGKNAKLNIMKKVFISDYEMTISGLKDVPLRGFAAVFGGFLLQFTMGAFYSFGNMSTYMTSYMRQHGSPDLKYTEFVVVQSTWGMTQGCVMPLSGFLIRAIGQKVITSV